METTLSFRKVNLNGSSVDSLIGEYRTARRAINAAITAFVQVRPHGRDFQMQAPPEFARAQDEYEQKLKELHGCLQFVEAHIYDLYEQKR